jgi:hypothetical protein
LYSDRIYNHLFLVLTESEKKELSVIEKNIDKLKDMKNDIKPQFGSKQQEDNIADLIEQFGEEKEKYLSKVAQNGKKNGTGNSKDKVGVATSVMDQQFSKFSVKEQSIKEPDVVQEQVHKFTISIIPKNSYKSPSKCEASYFGIGLILNTGGLVTGISEYSSIARQLNIKRGDYLLGFKNTDNTFYEGNRLIPLIQKNYKNKQLTIILKQDGKIVESPIVLDSICYERKGM